MTMPVPQSLIQISMFLGAMTFMYIGARTVGDADYRSRFLDPLIDDLRLTLIGPQPLSRGGIERADRLALSPSRTMLPVSDMRQVHEWFLHRGLPLVLTRRVRSRALIERRPRWSAASAR